jgi:hypothetical protein
MVEESPFFMHRRCRIVLARIAVVLTAFPILLRAQVSLTVSSTAVAVSGNQSQSITVSASNGGNISYTVTGAPTWLSVNSSTGFTTPDTLFFRLQAECGVSCNAILSLNPAGGGAGSQVTVSYGGTGTTIASSPPGAAFTVSGTGCLAGAYNTPQTLNWSAGAVCTVGFASPQNQIGAQYVFTGWQDGATSNPRVITALSQPATYTATFDAQFLLTTIASPATEGTVSGGGWYAANSVATVTASPANGYRFLNWTGAMAISGPTSATVTMTGPQTVTANFGLIPPPGPGTFTATLIMSNITAAGKAINNFGQVIGLGGSPQRAFLWTPTSANAVVGSLVDLGSLPSASVINTIPASINDQGQVVGTSGSQAFLWQPTGPNGTSGMMVPFLGLGTASSSAIGINDYGQIIGAQNGPFLWTPSQANATTGTLITDTRFGSLTSLNDFGQTVGRTGDGAPYYDTVLFTPTVRQGSSGTFTQIAAGQAPGIINSNGTVLMSTGLASCTSTFCGTAGYVWTPTPANSSTGISVQIPVSAVYVYPYAMNNRGQIVGNSQVYPTGDLMMPFLYSGGTVYDLSQLPNWPIGGIPVGTNDSGQIVVNANNSVYLLTLQPPQPPLPVTPNPQSGTGTNLTMTFTFTDPRGWQDLDVVNVLINNFLDGRNACYIAYSRSAGVVYLVADNGGTLSQGLTLGASGTVSNSQCSIASTGSSATGNSTTLVLTLNLTFTAGFAGNRVVYMAARDAAQNNSGWVPLGVWQVPGCSASQTVPPSPLGVLACMQDPNGEMCKAFGSPSVLSPSCSITGSTAVIGMNPASGTGTTSSTFEFDFSDTKGFPDLGVENILVNTALDGRHACYLAYSRPFNIPYLVNDNGDGLLPGKSLTAGGSLSNGQCTVAWGSSPVVADGNSLALVLSIAFTTSFSGNRIFYLAARDVNESHNTGWQAMGTWTVQ